MAAAAAARAGENIKSTMPRTTVHPLTHSLTRALISAMAAPSPVMSAAPCERPGERPVSALLAGLAPQYRHRTDHATANCSNDQQCLSLLEATAHSGELSHAFGVETTKASCATGRSDRRPQILAAHNERPPVTKSVHTSVSGNRQFWNERRGADLAHFSKCSLSAHICCYVRPRRLPPVLNLLDCESAAVVGGGLPR